MDTKGCSTPTRNSSIWSLKTKQCLLSGILIMVPFPMPTFKRSFALHYLRQVGPDFDLFASEPVLSEEQPDPTPDNEII